MIAHPFPIMSNSLLPSPQEDRLRQTCCHSILFLQYLDPGLCPLGDPVEALLGSMGERALSPLCSHGCIYNASPKHRQPNQDGQKRQLILS